jgi:hypothetical protein
MHPDLSPAPVVSELAPELWRSAAGVLDANWAGDHTVPSRSLHPHQWSWDTAFIAIGLAYVNPGRAWRDLRSLFEAQWPDGRVPHIVFDPSIAEDAYFPGPAFWNVPAYGRRPPHSSTGLIQPPLHALAAWEVYRHSAAHGAAALQQARTELEWIYPRLVAQQQYLATRRNAGGGGLAALVHPWESGSDDDADHARHLDLASNYRDGGYCDTDLVERHSYVVECPGFNAILGTAEDALGHIARVLDRPADAQRHWRAAHRITMAIIERLWNPYTGMFHARDLRTGELSPASSVNGLLPLVLGHLPRGHVAAISREMRAERRPVWMHVNWLIRRGMMTHGCFGTSEEMRRELLCLAHRNGHFEHFDPEDGSGLGAPAFSRTAALCLDLLADPPPSEYGLPARDA